MEKLTKKGFFNKAMETFPKSMEVFCKYIDKWKQENRWKILCGDGIVYYTSDSEFESSVSVIVAPKFHDLPAAMQLGIIIELSNKIGLDIQLGKGCLEPRDVLSQIMVKVLETIELKLELNDLENLGL